MTLLWPFIGASGELVFSCVRVRSADKFIFRNFKTKRGEPKAFRTLDLSLVSGEYWGGMMDVDNDDRKLDALYQNDKIESEMF